MPDALVTAVLGRLHEKTCSLAELEDLVPPADRESGHWAPAFVEHPLTTLLRWGLIDAKYGFTPLSADEVLHVSFDARVWELEFKMSSTSLAIEEALGRDIWSSTANAPME